MNRAKRRWLGSGAVALSLGLAVACGKGSPVGVVEGGGTSGTFSGGSGSSTDPDEPRGGGGQGTSAAAAVPEGGVATAGDGGYASGGRGEPMVPEGCGSASADEAATANANGPVGPPPSGYLVYLAETSSLGRQVYHVRIHEGAVQSPVRLTPDAGVDGFMVSQNRRAAITVAARPDSGEFLTLVDFDAAGATRSQLLNPLNQGDGIAFDQFALSPEGNLLFASNRQGLMFLDLRPRTPALTQARSGYTYSSTHDWVGSRLLFYGRAQGSTQGEVFFADSSGSPPVVELLTADGDVGSLRISDSPNHERAVYYRKSSSGEAKWYLVDLTPAGPATVPLSSPALRAPVSLGVLAWSPDSRYYLVEVNPGGLVLVDTEAPSSGQVVSAESATHFMFASFSPDSQRLVYAASHGGSDTTQLYGVALHGGAPGAPYPLIRGTEEEQTVHLGWSGSFEWIHGSQYVYYWAPGQNAFYLADASGCSGRRVPLRSRTGDVVLQTSMRPAPNAPRAAFFSEHWTPGNHDLFVADIDAGGNWREPTRISEVGGGDGQREVTFLDPDWLMYYEGDADRRLSMYLAPRDGSVAARRLTGPKDAVVFTHWVPDAP